MNTVKELQHSLSQIIYSISDLKSLSKIKSIVDDFIKPIQKQDNLDNLPWKAATLSMKKVTSFEDIARLQGNKNLTFEELYPYIDTSDSDYDVDDLLAALN